MSKFVKRFSITSRTLRPQLTAAFCLMSVIPILALLNFIFPSLMPQTAVATIVVTVVVMALFGFVLIKRIVDPIIALSSEARVIANGELTRRVSVARNDEIGDLSNSLNQLTQHIRDNMDELKIYSDRTKDINLKINKQVFALNGLLQIGSLISRGASLSDVFEIAVSRLVQVADSSFAFLILVNEGRGEVAAQCGLSAESLAFLRDPARVHLLQDFVASKAVLKSDRKNGGPLAASWQEALGAKNILMAPVLAHWKATGIVGVGSQLDDFEYEGEDAELLNIFAKQLAIAVENDFLAEKVKELEITDVQTGLYNKRYMVARLKEEILRAISHQKPCSYIAARIENFADMKERWGALVAESVLVKVALALKPFVNELDRAGRLEEDEFGIVLPDKNKRQAQELAVRIEEKMRQIFGAEETLRRPLLRVSVVENPLDGADADSLLSNVEKMVRTGKKE